MRWVRVAIALLAVAAAGMPPAPPTAVAAPPRVTKVPDPEYPPEFRAKVRKAIERGVKFLRIPVPDPPPVLYRWPLPPESMVIPQTEEREMVTWALRGGGAPDPAMEAKHSKAGAGVRTAPILALRVLASTVAPLRQGDPFAGADPSTPPGTSPDRMLDLDVRLLLLDQARTSMGSGPDGGWGEQDSASDLRTDVASTCLVLLALESASRRGVTVPPTVFFDAMQFLLSAQDPKGPPATLRMNEVRGTDRFEWVETGAARGFGILPALADDSTGYCTACGVLGLIVCQDALQKEASFTKELRLQTRTAIRDALAWLATHFVVTKNPTPGVRGELARLSGARDHHRWLHALAALALHSRMRLVGWRDWYKDGAEFLMGTQRGDGSWGGFDRTDTCYALLFLMRSGHASTTSVLADLPK